MAVTVQNQDNDDLNQPTQSAGIGQQGQSEFDQNYNQTGQSNNSSNYNQMGQSNSSNSNNTNNSNNNPPPVLGFSGQSAVGNQNQYNSSNPTGPAQPAATPRGTGFTNIQSILAANQGNQLGSALQQGVNNQVQNVGQNINSSLANFQNQVGANNLNTTANQTAIQQALANPTSAIGSGTQAQNIQNLFAQIRAGQYTGPTQMANANQLSQQANMVSNLGQEANTGAGQQELLQQFVGQPGYNQGEQNLDQLLLGATGQQNLNAIKNQTQGIGQQYNQANIAAQQAVTQAQQQAQQLAQNTQQETNQAITNQMTPINQALAAAQAQNSNTQANYNNLLALFAGQGITNNDVAMASGNAPGQGGLTQYATTGQWNLNQPFNATPDVGQQTAAGMQQGQAQSVGTYLGLNEAVQQGLLTEQQAAGLGNQFILSEGNIPNANIGQIFANALTNNQAQNLTAAGVATPQQQANVNALQQLAGQNVTFAPAGTTPYQAASNALNYNALEAGNQQAVENQYLVNNAAGEAAAAARGVTPAATPSLLSGLHMGGSNSSNNGVVTM